VKVLMITSEATPFAQTGGLGEVLSALPAELVRQGIEVDVALPKYRHITPDRWPITRMGSQVSVHLNATSVAAPIWELRDDRGVRYLFVENDAYFNREGLYGGPGGDYEDNSERFVFLTRAAFEMALTGKIKYDLFHSHDWQAALAPVYLRTLYAGEELFEESASVLTIHNLGFQGIFGQGNMPMVGLGWELFNPDQMEFYGQLNFLKSGIVFVDEVNTVSPGYRNEILTGEFGFGLEGVLQDKASHLTGILNGVDYSVWNPATDPLIPANFNHEDLSGKTACKAQFQKFANLPVNPHVPLIGTVSRLSNQKGIDLLEAAIPGLVDQNVQLALLGAGDERYHRVFQELAKQYPHHVRVFLTYDMDLAHRIFAAADIVVVPSRYEPCGLNQLYGLKYGAIPVVRATGGLNDTVEEYNRHEDRGTGFKFYPPEVAAFEHALLKAITLYRQDQDAWKRLVARAIEKDFSWSRSAAEYKKLYEKALANRRAMLAAR